MSVLVHSEVLDKEGTVLGRTTARLRLDGWVLKGEAPMRIEVEGTSHSCRAIDLHGNLRYWELERGKHEHLKVGDTYVAHWTADLTPLATAGESWASFAPVDEPWSCQNCAFATTDDEYAREHVAVGHTVGRSNNDGSYTVISA